MKTLPRVLIVLVALVGFPGVCPGQESADGAPSAETASDRKDDSSPEPSKRDLFLDPDDGQLDLSRFLASRKGFLPVGGLITEPAVGYGATLGLMFLSDSIKDRAAQMKERNLERLPPPSVTWAGGFATTNGSWGGGLAHLGVFKEDRYRYRGAFFYAGMNLDYYGSGGDLGLPVDSVSYTLDGFSLLQQLERRLGDSNVFLGLNYRFSSFDTKLDLGLGLDPPEWFPSLERKIKSSGVGGLVRYDSRDSIFTPDSGISATAQTIFYDEALGGDRTFRKGQAKLRGWQPIKESWVLGVRVDAELSGGDTPFYMLPSVEMRGIPSNRYQGQDALSVEAELRWDLTSRWSLLGFLGSGWAAEDGMGDFVFNQGHVAGGTGFRYLISRVFRIRTGMDFAWSDEDFAFYFTTGTAWGER
jgi:hypothetical protein